MVYSNSIEDKIGEITDELVSKYSILKNLRGLSINLLENDKEITNKCSSLSSDLLRHSNLLFIAE